MTGRRHDPRPSPTTRDEEYCAHLSDLLDDALDNTFPASDPPALLQPKRRPPSNPDRRSEVQSR